MKKITRVSYTLEENIVRDFHDAIKNTHKNTKGKKIKKTDVIRDAILRFINKNKAKNEQ